jgi:Flp pilus assembly protein TadG
VPGGKLLTATVRQAVRSAANRAAHSGDRGSVAVFSAMFVFAVLLLLGLLVDGGNVLNARERAADVAEQAARAAVTDVSIGNLHGQGTNGPETLAIDWTTACSYALQTVTDYASDTGGVTGATMANCRQGTNPLTATVTVVVTSNPAIPVPGFDSTITMTATQSATAECGTADQQEAC